jgi:hypothetical protein
MARGNKGYFFGAPLQLLQKHLPQYLKETRKDKFWSTFFPAWDTAFPTMDDDDERKELADEEVAFKEETARVKEENAAARKKSGRRKAVLLPLPFTTPRLDELRARAADRSVCYFISVLFSKQALLNDWGWQKLKSWFSNQKTKDKSRKVEPFRDWLGCLAQITGTPRYTRLPWLA